ncbi:hypothetical protein [Antarcticirhabdus aurantiaca]|uniref:Uncharacterized protein n=1 Tax=Antarcticirhabdus aurantiaca TaxID=2606717 RepID=A0ACD4NHN8_9HYPH|nr:hypothetical protein OXU80_15355 [Jeongeuplla avenae]
MTKARGVPAKRYEFRGEMKTAAEIGEILGLHPATIKKRIKSGKSIQDRELEKLERPSRGKTYTFAGKTMTLCEWAKTLGIEPGTLKERLCSPFWPLERALAEPVMGRSQRSVYRKNLRIIERIAESVREETRR